MTPAGIHNTKLRVLDVLSRLRRRLLGRHVSALLVQSNNGLFLVDAEDLSAVGRKLAYSGQYAAYELALLYGAIRPESRVLVVGTHVGSLAIALSKRCAHLTAIEANPKTFKLLEFNLLLNHCANVNAIHIAASDKREEIEFIMGRTNSGGSKRAPAVGDFAYFYDSPDTAKVTAAPLDEVLDGQQFDVIVMDIEGSEYFALEGMPRLLGGCRDLFVEYVPHHLKNVSCATVPQFVATISPYFSHLYIPSRNMNVDQEGFVAALQKMYDAAEWDDGLHFSKEPMSSQVATSVSASFPF